MGGGLPFQSSRLVGCNVITWFYRSSSNRKDRNRGNVHESLFKREECPDLQQLSVFALLFAGTLYLFLLYGDPKGSLPKAQVFLSLFHILNQDLYTIVKYHILRPFATGRGK